MSKQHQIWNNRFQTKVTEPKDLEDKQSLSLVLYSKSWLQAISKECLPHADDSEFQIGYRALVIHLKSEHSSFYVTIPTSTYNFPQEVSGARVEYELSDIEKFGKEASDASMTKLNELTEKMPMLMALKTMAEAGGYDFSVVESNCGSIHRHPGDFSFSATDYDKDPENPGVIYRMGNVQNHAQTDSVLYVKPDGITKIVVTETRIVNVKPHADGGIDGTYTEIPTVCVVTDDYELEDGLVTMLGEIEAKPEKLYTMLKTLGAKHKYPVLKMIIDEYVKIQYSPDVSNIDGNRIEQKSYRVVTQTNSSKKKSRHQEQWEPWMDEDEWYDYYGLI